MLIVFRLSVTVSLALIAAGCATPIGVNYVDRSVAYHSLTANVLSTGSPSSFSLRELMNWNLYQRFDEDPVGALAEMRKGLAATGEQRVAKALRKSAPLIRLIHLFKPDTASCYP